MATNSKVTLALVCQKLDSHTAILEEHVKKDEKFQAEWLEAMNGCDEYPGLRGRLQRVEDVEASRKWHIRSLWATATAAVISWLAGTRL
mgnify:FL=1